MTLWTATEAVSATGGRSPGDWQATGVSIDTRTLQPGDLFVALKDIRDGHAFVADALAKGAAAALVSRVPDGVAPDAPLLIVDDVLTGLEALGRAARDRTKAQVIGVTGSVGKSSTKDMLRHVLGRQGRTHAAEASYNNHWGVPLTLARMPADTEFAVIEIGMNHPGEIAPLAAMARPHVAIVTTVAAAHLEAFDDIAGIAVEKASIFSALEPDGTAIYDADIETAPILRDVAAKRARQVITFGSEADVALAQLDGNVVYSTIADFELGAPGRHMAMNALAVLAATGAVGGNVAHAARALAEWTPTEGRGMRTKLAIPGGEIDLIDDAYNANPTSLAAALDVLATLEGRRVLILGDMLELGPQAEALHVEIARHPAMAKVALVHTAGPLMAALWDALPPEKRGVKAADVDALDPHDLVRAGDTILVKGSKGSRVSKIAEAIRALGQEQMIMV